MPTLEHGNELDSDRLVPVLDSSAAMGWRPVLAATKPPPKPPNLRRIVLLGGSNTQRFPRAVLEQELAQRSESTGLEFEVVNLGRAGFGSQRVLEMFEKGSPSSPM